jgi:hypothetical protein
VVGRYCREPPIHHLPCRPSNTATLISANKTITTTTFSFSETATGARSSRMPSGRMKKSDQPNMQRRSMLDGSPESWLATGAKRSPPPRCPSRRLSTLTIVVAVGPAEDRFEARTSVLSSLRSHHLIQRRVTEPYQRPLWRMQFSIQIITHDAIVFVGEIGIRIYATA